MSTLTKFLMIGSMLAMAACTNAGRFGADGTGASGVPIA